MPDLTPLEPGVMFWAGRDDPDTIRALGVRCGQLGIPPEIALDAIAWKTALEDLTIVTVFAAFAGESYADIPTVQATVGFVPPATRAEREDRFYEISDLASQLGVAAIACHIGCVPEDRTARAYLDVRDLVRRICDYAGHHRQSFALETGQESAAALRQFILDVDRPNLRINFDPANMILYGTGDPIEALDTLAPYVESVHAKDGDWPPRDRPQALGSERPLGQGSVGIPRFVEKLREIGFRGPLNVERETDDPQERLRDIGSAITILRELTAARS
jgi:sugar phosphate isomerase/epimerase